MKNLIVNKTLVTRMPDDDDTDKDKNETGLPEKRS